MLSVWNTRWLIYISIIIIGFCIILKLLNAPSVTVDDDPVFRLYPLKQKKVLMPESGFLVSTPFHSYDMNGFVIHGWMEKSDAMIWLRDENLRPVMTSDGKALVSVWIIRHDNSSCGPYNEIVFSVNSAPSDCVLHCSSTDPFCGPYAVISNPDSIGLIHRLWLDTDIGIAYGRELLSLDKRKGIFDSKIEESDTSIIKVKDEESGNIVLDISVSPQTDIIQQLKMIPKMIKTFGLKNTILLGLSDVLYAGAAGKIGVASFTEEENNRIIFAQSSVYDKRFQPWRNGVDVIRTIRLFDDDERVDLFHPTIIQTVFHGRFVMMDTTDWL